MRNKRDTGKDQPFQLSLALAGNVRPNSSIGSRLPRANRRPRGTFMSDEPSRIIWAADDPQDTDLGIEDLGD